MTYTPLSTVIIIFLTSLTVFWAWRGYKRGLTRSAIGLCAVIISAFFSIALVHKISADYAGDLFALFYDLEIIPPDLDILEQYADVVILLLRIIMSLILFLPAFGVIRLIIAIPSTILCRILIRKRTSYLKEGESLYIREHRRIGASVGAVAGFLLAIVLLTPLTGILKTAAAGIQIYETIAQEEIEDPSGTVDAIIYYSSDFGIDAMDACGGHMLFDLATTVTLHGDTSNLNRELAVLNETNIDDITHLLATLSNFKATDIASAESILDQLSESMIIRLILTETIRGASSAWLKNDSYLGIPRPSFGDHFAIERFTNEILYACSTTTYETVKNDIKTLLGLGKIFATALTDLDLTDYEALVEELMAGGLLNTIRDELAKNPHMLAVSFAVDDLVMSVVTEELQNSLKYTDAERDALYDELADILTSTLGLEGTVREVEVTESIRESLAEYGVYIPEGLNDLNSKIAKELIAGIDTSGGTVTREDIQAFFDAFLASGGVADLLPDTSFPMG